MVMYGQPDSRSAYTRYVRPSGDGEMVSRDRLEHAARLVVLLPQRLIRVARHQLSTARAGRNHVGDVTVDARPVHAEVGAALRSLDALVRLVQTGEYVSAEAGRDHQTRPVYDQAVVQR